MARLILSAGILTPLASWIALRNRGLPSASPPPIRAAMVISLMSFVNMRPRFASMAPFLCLMLCHLEWPDIDYSLVSAQFGFSLAQLRREKNEQQKGTKAANVCVIFMPVFSYFFVGCCCSFGPSAEAFGS